jgi:hypothetical protein
MPRKKWTMKNLEQTLDRLGYDLVGYEPGGVLHGSSFAGKPAETAPYCRARRQQNGHAIYGRSPEHVFELIERYEAELSSRGHRDAAVSVVRDAVSSVALMHVRSRDDVVLPAPTAGEIEAEGDPDLVSA